MCSCTCKHMQQTGNLPASRTGTYFLAACTFKLGLFFPTAHSLFTSRQDLASVCTRVVFNGRSTRRKVAVTFEGVPGAHPETLCASIVDIFNAMAAAAAFPVVAILAFEFGWTGDSIRFKAQPQLRMWQTSRTFAVARALLDKTILRRVVSSYTSADVGLCTLTYRVFIASHSTQSWLFSFCIRFSDNTSSLSDDTQFIGIITYLRCAGSYY